MLKYVWLLHCNVWGGGEGPGVGLQIVPAELLFPSVRAEEGTGLRNPALPDMSQLDVLATETGGLEQAADILVVLVI